MLRALAGITLMLVASAMLDTPNSSMIVSFAVAAVGATLAFWGMESTKLKESD